MGGEEIVYIYKTFWTKKFVVTWDNWKEHIKHNQINNLYFIFRIILRNLKKLYFFYRKFLSNAKLKYLDFDRFIWNSKMKYFIFCTPVQKAFFYIFTKNFLHRCTKKLIFHFFAHLCKKFFCTGVQKNFFACTKIFCTHVQK